MFRTPIIAFYSKGAGLYNPSQSGQAGDKRRQLQAAFFENFESPKPSGHFA
jgi:hypothetical protein